MTSLTPPDRLQRCRALVERYRSLSGAPNVVVAITDSKQTIETIATGRDEAHLRTLATRPVPIGSITKTIVALAMLRATRQGLVDLDQPVARWVNAFDDDTWRSVRLRDLLTHTSGLSIGSLASPWSDRDLRVATALPRFDDMPGTFYYSNLGYEALGQVLERVQDTPLGDLLERTVLRPLGMQGAIGRVCDSDRDRIAAGYACDDSSSLHWVGEPVHSSTWEAHTGAAGCVAASIDDMCRMLRDLARSPTDAEFGHEWSIAIEPRVLCQPDVSYGFGVVRETSGGRDRVYHSGGMIGHRSLAMFDRTHGHGVAVLTDLGGPLRGSLILRLGHAVLDVLGGVDHPESVVDYAVDVDPRCAGTFVDEHTGEALTFSRKNDRWALHSGETELPMQWTEIQRCMTSHPAWREFEFQFERDAAGQLDRVIHAGRLFARHGSAPSLHKPTSAARYRRAGLYRSRNPWASRVRVTEGQLGLAVHVAPLGAALLPLGNDVYRVAHTPEVVRFDDVHEGKAHVVDLSGSTYVRDDHGGMP